MKTWAALTFPVALFAGAALLPALYPAAAAWSEHATFRALPYLLLCVNIGIGGVFHQSRISFIAALLLLVTAMLDTYFFRAPNPARAATVLLLSLVYVPWLTALLYRLSERGMFTTHGAVRGLIVFSAALVIILLSGIADIGQAVAASGHFLLRRTAAGFNIPLFGSLTLLGCAPFLLWPQRHESPLLGPSLLIAVLFFFTAVSFGRPVPQAGRACSAFLTFMSGAGLVLIWAVLETMWRSANYDDLTELPGRHALKHHLNRLSPPYAIAMVDIDRFKLINDRHGHAVGDQVLRFIARHVRRNAAGKAYRYGGEEFTVVCQLGAFKDAVAALQTMRKTVAGSPFRVRGKDRPRAKPERQPEPRPSVTVSVTVSIGLAASRGESESPADVLRAADQALYEAKRKGRNRLCVRRDEGQLDLSLDVDATDE